MYKVHNWWTLAAAVLFVIIIFNVLSRGQTSIGLVRAGGTATSGIIKALEVPGNA